MMHNRSFRSTIQAVVTWPREWRARREQSRQLGMALSWQGAQDDLADPVFRAYLENSLAGLRRKHKPQGEILDSEND